MKKKVTKKSKKNPKANKHSPLNKDIALGKKA
jgi:hypothetical protein